MAALLCPTVHAVEWITSSGDSKRFGVLQAADGDGIIAFISWKKGTIEYHISSKSTKSEKDESYKVIVEAPGHPKIVLPADGLGYDPMTGTYSFKIWEADATYLMHGLLLTKDLTIEVSIKKEGKIFQSASKHSYFSEKYVPAATWILGD